jgi:hypothetical protein
VNALNESGPLRERLEQAFIQLALLGRVDVVVPEEIAPEVQEMHAMIEKWVLPGQTNALGTSVAWIEDEELPEWERRIRHWHGVVEAAVDGG